MQRPATATYFADLRSNELLTPSMRRIVFEVDPAYASSGIADEWIRLFIPNSATETAVLPVSEGKGWSFPDDIPREGRWYTIRALREHQLTVDVVLHAGGVAADWAATAQPGQRIAISGPDGRYGADQPTDWELIVADLTGLPAALRILEELPVGRQAIAVLEAPGPDDEQPVHTDASVQVQWVHNPDHGRGASRLAQAVRALPWADGTPYVWMGAEAAATRDVRTYVRRERRVPNGCADVIGYWSLRRNTAS